MDLPRISDEMYDQYADEWMTSGQIAKLIGMSSNTLPRWYQRGVIRAVDSGVRRQHSPWMLYHVGDCMIQLGKRKKLEPHRHKMVDGVQMFMCNYCHEWKLKDDFYPDKTKSRQHGILSYCKPCHRDRCNAREIDPMVQFARNQRKKEISKQRSIDAKLATDWNPTLVSAVDAYEIVKRLRPGMADSHICEEAGVHNDTVRRIARQADEGRMCKIETIDKLLVGLGEVDAARKLYDMLDDGRPRWHPKYDYCQRCLRTEVAFMAAGLCSTCYRRRKDPTYVPHLERQWSKTRTFCSVCLRSDRPHRAKGRCNPCYIRWRRSMPGAVGSGHGNPESTPEEQGTDPLVIGRDDLGSSSGRS